MIISNENTPEVLKILIVSYGVTIGAGLVYSGFENWSFFLIGAGIGILIWTCNGVRVWQKKEQEKLDREKDEKLNKTKIDFYKECCSNDIRACLNDREIRKASLIATKYKIEYTDIAVLFQDAKTLFDLEKK